MKVALTKALGIVVCINNLCSITIYSILWIFQPPTPTLTPEIVILMCVATSHIFHRMKNVDFVILLLCSMVGLIILKGESETNNPDQWCMNTNLL